MTNVFNKLVENDVYISRKLQSIVNRGVPKDRIAEAFTQDISLSAISALHYFEDKYQQHIEKWHNPQNRENEQLSSIWSHFVHRDFSNLNIEQAKIGFLKEGHDASEYRMSSDVLISCEYDDSENVKYPTNYVNV